MLDAYLGIIGRSVMEFDKNKWKKEWEIFCGRSREQIDSKDYRSLLETILENYNGKLFEQYNNIKKLMHNVYENRDLQSYIIDKKDFTHENRILHYLDDFLFDRNCPAENGKYSAVIDMSDEDIFVLLCGVHLHDYGKTRWELTIYSLLENVITKINQNHSTSTDYNQIFTELKQGSFILKDANDMKKRAIEHFDSVYKAIGGKALHELGPSETGLIEDYHTQNINLFLEAVIAAKGTDGKSSRENFILNKIIPGDENQPEHKLFHHLKTLDAEYLQKIKVIASAHKAHKQYNEEEEDEYYDGAGDQKWLCALLRLSDSLDMDKHRVIEKEKRDLTYLYEHYLKDSSNNNAVDDSKLRTFAVWTRFLLIKQIDINHHRGEGSNHCINIIINYYRFPHADEYFFTLRYMSEKDFRDARFLTEILKKIHVENENVRITLTYQVLNERNSDYPDIDIKGGIKDVFDKAKEKYQAASPTTENPFEMLFHKIDDVSQTFIPFAPDLIKRKDASGNENKSLFIPREFKLCWFLNCFKDAKTIPNDDLQEQLGYKNKNDIPFHDHFKSHDYFKAKIIQKVSDREEYCFTDNALEIIKNLFIFMRRHPILVKSKIDELQNFNGLMPFTRAEGIPGILTGIPGLDEVISGATAVGGEIKHSRNILIKGGPGTGKTTVAIQVFMHNSNSYSKYTGKQVLYLTFEENPTRIECECAESFGWDIDKERILQFKTCESKFDSLEKLKTTPEEMAREAANIFMNIIKSYHADILFVDSLNRLQSFLTNKGLKDFKKTIRHIFDGIEMWHMTAFYLLEDDDQSKFEEYVADGIIYLENKDGNRTFEIRKLRNQKYVAGKHSFKIVDQNYLKSAPMLEPVWLQAGINVFPNIRTYTERIDQSSSHEGEHEIIETGIEGLDDLLPINSWEHNDKGGFLKKNIILVIGSPGSGKTIFGLHFIKKGLEKGETCLWISFEGRKADLKFTVNRFHPDLKFKEIFGGTDGKSNDHFLFHYFSPAYFNQDELIFSIRKIIDKKPKVKRFVIDSISEIESLFNNENEFKNFMATMINELRRLDLTTIFLYRSAEFFGFQKQTKTAISSLVDTIISIKTFDIKNKIKKGLFVLKSRGREQKSDLQTMEILYDKGLVVSDKGWELEGLLSGETGEIKEPYIFLKLFYEKPAETKINEYLINDFEKRYPMENRLFTCVRKPHIYSEFWSFRGNYGAGHSNIRIVSLNKYMVEAFRENDRLHILDGYFSSSLRHDIKSDTRWNKYFNNDGEIDFLPSYSDFGVFVFQKHLVAQFDTLSDICTKDWKTVLDTLKNICDKLPVSSGRKRYPFAMPPLDNMTEFVAFFMEILWSRGGDLYLLPPFSEKKSRNRLSFYKKMVLKNCYLQEEARGIIKDNNSTLSDDPKIATDIKKAIEKTLNEFVPIYKIPDVIRINDKAACKALEFICDLVTNGYCQNPAEGDFRPYAISSRKWYSEVVELKKHIASIEHGEEDKYKIHRDGTKGKGYEPDVNAVNLELYKLPYFTESMKSVTNQGIWCLSIIKDALSPEIAWIFIDSMVSPETRRMRSAEKLGFPIKIEDVRSETYNWADKKIYNEVAQIMSNDAELDKKTQNLAVLIVLRSTVNEFSEIKKNLEGKCPESEIRYVCKKLCEDLHNLAGGKLFGNFINVHGDQPAKEREIRLIIGENFIQNGFDKGKVKGTTNGYLIKMFVKNNKKFSEQESKTTEEDLKDILCNCPLESITNFINEEKKKLSEKLTNLFNTFYDVRNNSGPPLNVNESVIVDVAKDFTDTDIPDNRKYEFKFKPNSKMESPLYCSKLVANRPYFYRIEPIIHRHIRKLFTDSEKPDKGQIPNVLNAIRKEMIIEIFKNPGL